MFRLSESYNYMMPAHFGGIEGPPPATTYPDVTSMILNYETDPGMLAQYIPEVFELTQPLVSITYSINRAVGWLGGGAYNLIAVNVPVAYINNRERLDGQYALVLWENKTAPILTGREQTGMPKIFADIEDLHQLSDSVFTTASHEGSAFLRLELHKRKMMAPEELTVLNQQRAWLNWFGWRYIPNTGRSGAALSHATFYPLEFAYTAAWPGEGKVQWEPPTPERHPTQAPIIRALSQLPIMAYHECLMTQGSMVLRNDLAKPLP